MKGNAVLVFVLLFMSNLVYSQQNDHIFPAAPSAKKYIDFDKQGFIIDGEKTFLVSAGLEYARIPHQLWRDRLLRLKRAGFNCIEIYTFWNFHEPHEGRFDFSGDHDLDAFLKLVKQMGMYATVRVGPYYCAEWDLGGYPIWLHFKGDFPVRQPNAEFEKYADRFFDKLIPIVSNNQVNHGGSVILVQVENEHDSGWGTLMPNSYFKHLQDKLLSLGIQVPYFFSGLHHGSDPAGNGTGAFDDPNRPNPWYTTEFWSVWYNYYGSTQKDADLFGRRTWKIIAHGGAGYNYYMAHGGTNFGYTNNDEDAASYDYGAPVGQTGDLRPVYYQFKRNALFARGFESILCNAANASAAYQDIVSDTIVRVYARHSKNGDIAFLDNHGAKEVSLQVNADHRQWPSSGPLTLAPGEIMPIVRDFRLTPQVRLDWGVSRILGIGKQGHTTTLVTYGPAGSAGELQFSVNTPVYFLSGKDAFSTASETHGLNSSKSIVLHLVFKDGEPLTYSFRSGEELIRIIALDPNLADRTWFADSKGKKYIITGPEYLGEVNTENDHVWLSAEHFWEQTKRYPTTIFSGAGSQTIPETVPATAHTQELTLDAWQSRSASAAAEPGFDDGGWFQSHSAEQMGADDDLTCYAWYRTHIHPDSTGDYLLKIKNGGDRATVFIDGVHVASGAIPGTLAIRQLAAGNHTLAIFTAHSGRNKLYNYYGPIRYKDAKGLSGDIFLQKGNDSILLSGWRMKGGPGEDPAINDNPANGAATSDNHANKMATNDNPVDSTATNEWKPLQETDSFDRPRFYKSHFNFQSTASLSHPMWRVSFEGLGHGSIWVNGHNLGRYPEKIPVKSLYIPECWLVKGNNSMVIYDEDGDRPDKISIRAENVASRDIEKMDARLDHSAVQKKSPADHVNPFIGTSSRGDGRTIPGAITPFGMVQVSPNTITGGDNGQGYIYENEYIEGFAFTQMSGTGWYGDLGNLLTTPANGPLQVMAGRHPELGKGYRSHYKKDDEVAKPGYYAATLTDYNVRAEATAAPHSGMLRFTFPENERSRIQIDLARRCGGTSVLQSVKVVDEHTIEGWMQCTPDGGGWGDGDGKADYTVYFHAVFSKPLKDFGVWSAEIPDGISRKRESAMSAHYDSLIARSQILAGCKGKEGRHLGFYTEFSTRPGEIVMMKSGISFSSIEGAKDNLTREIPAWDFDGVAANAERLWNRQLSKISVNGGTEDQQAAFYTAMYHTMMDPRTITDLNGDYPGADHRIHKAANFTKVSIFSGWDVFRSQFPLQTIINPRAVSDMITSLVDMADRSGKHYLERWELLNAYSGCMVGNPAVVVIADAYNKGIRNFNVEDAYKNAKLSVDKFGNGKNARIDGDDISKTLEYSFSEWCLANLAASLGKKEDVATYSKLAKSYVNVFNPEKGWFRPRNPDGSWRPWPVEGRLKQSYGCVESDPYQQGWFVPQDIPGLAHLLGGREKMIADLDSFFEKTPKDLSWNNYYNQSNEPVHLVPFMFNRLGAPWLTQKWVRMVSENGYHNSISGLVGNEDVGQMSAWFVLAACGFHQACPGDPRYELFSPLFDTVSVHAGATGKTFEIIARGNSPENLYIQSASLNGKSYNKCHIDHRDMLNGGKLELVMGPEPNKNWGLE